MFTFNNNSVGKKFCGDVHGCFLLQSRYFRHGIQWCLGDKNCLLVWGWKLYICQWRIYGDINNLTTCTKLRVFWNSENGFWLLRALKARWFLKTYEFCIVMLQLPFALHLTDSAGRGAQPFGGFCVMPTFSAWGHTYFCIKALVGGCPLPTHRWGCRAGLGVRSSGCSSAGTSRDCAG